MLEDLVLVEQTRGSLATAIADALAAAFGRDAGIVLTDPAWGLSKPGPTGARTYPLGDHGTIAVPHHMDGRAFAARLAARLTDFEAIEQERRRAQKLASLYEAAHEFSSELDIDRTLETIVRRGRALTGADICYLSLNDFDRGETYICTTAGVRTEAFKQVRLRYGDGLGGLVAKEGKPYYSSDYIHDERFVHVVDPEVATEGVVSVMGVPLKLGDRVIGVLFAANRYLSAFDDEDVAFLESLADHAAIAIENARLYSRLDRGQRLHRRLTELVLAERSIDVLEREIGEALGLQVRVLENEHVEADDRTVIVRAGPIILGALRATEPLDEETGIALEQAARVLAVLLLKERAVLQAQLRTRGELLDAIMSGSLPEDEIARRASVDGLDVASPHRAVALPHGHESLASREAPGAFIATRRRTTIVLLPAGTPIPPFELAGVGNEQAGVAGIAASVGEAVRALRIGAALGRSGAITGADLGVYGMLLDPDRTRELIAQARMKLAPLIDYDEAHDGVLVPTLEAYLDAQGKPGEAAKALFMHVNSLYYRLTRIKELTDWDLGDPELRLQLHLACRILRLEAALVAPS